jgi:hypothetical protein
LTIVMLFVGGASCGGGGAAELPLPPFVPGSVTALEYQEVFDGAGDYLKTVLYDADAAQKMVLKMKTYSQVVFAEVTQTGDVIAFFRDGRHVSVLLNEKPPRPGTRPQPQSVAKAPSGGPKNLVAGKKAYMFNAMDPGWTDATPQLATMMRDKGYDVTEGAGTVEDFRNIRDAAFVFVHAHGRISRDRNNKKTFWYLTSSDASGMANDPYTTYWQEGSIGVALVPVYGAPTTAKPVLKYEVSTKFFTSSGVTLVPGAFWLSQSCSSFDDSAVNALSALPNLSVYGGWTLPCDADETTPTMLFMFDRLLGKNEAAPVPAEPQPPTTFGELPSLLATTIRPGGTLPYDSSITPDGRSYLRFKTGTGPAIKTIIPSIESATVDVEKNQLKISGNFGTELGAVTLNGSNLNVISHTESLIICDKPSQDEGTLFLRSMGAPGASGLLFSNSYAYKAFGLELNPKNAEVDPNQTRSFTVAVTQGTLPSGAKYEWTVLGDGKVNNQTSVTTTSTTVTYRAPNADASDTLRVRAVTSTGTVLAETTALISVGNTPRIQFTLSGTWDPDKTPANGTYIYTDGGGNRMFPEAGTEVLFFSHNIGATDQTIGALVTIVLTPGQVVVPATYSKFVQGQAPSPGQFQFTLSTNQSNPDDPESRQYAVGTTGSLTITSVTSLSGNRKRARYTFTISNGIGGTCTGSGTQVWQE